MQGPRQPEIQQLEHSPGRGTRAFGSHHDVGGLHIAVHDALLVRSRQAVRDLNGEVERLLDRQRPPPQHPLERLAGVARHRDEDLPRPGLADIVDRANVHVVESPGSPCLAQHARLRVRVGDQVNGQKLERYRAFQSGVAGLVDDAHPAFAELARDPVVRNGRVQQ